METIWRNKFEVVWKSDEIIAGIVQKSCSLPPATRDILGE